MFTGIVEAVSEVVEISPAVLAVADPQAWPTEPWQIGESVCVNGCCLTLASHDERLLFDLSEETWRRTSFRTKAVGHPVNLERAMRANGRFGGHFVQGHVDGVCDLVAMHQYGESTTLCFTCEHPEYLIDKGSVTVDGVSLTVIEPQGREFSVAIVPHTWRHTSLSSIAVGAACNIEYDVLAKYVENLLNRR